MDRWLIDKYGSSADLSICIVFHSWKETVVMVFRFWGHGGKQATAWQKWAKKKEKEIDPAALKKKKKTFGRQFWLCVTSETEKASTKHDAISRGHV